MQNYDNNNIIIIDFREQSLSLGTPIITCRFNEIIKIAQRIHTHTAMVMAFMKYTKC